MCLSIYLYLTNPNQNLRSPKLILLNHWSELCFKILNETKLVNGFYRNRRYLANLHLPPEKAHQKTAKIVSQN